MEHTVNVCCVPCAACYHYSKVDLSTLVELTLPWILIRLQALFTLFACWGYDRIRGLPCLRLGGGVPAIPNNQQEGGGVAILALFARLKSDKNHPACVFDGFDVFFPISTIGIIHTWGNSTICLRTTAHAGSINALPPTTRWHWRPITCRHPRGCCWKGRQHCPGRLHPIARKHTITSPYIGWHCCSHDRTGEDIEFTFCWWLCYWSELFLSAVWFGRNCFRRTTFLLEAIASGRWDSFRKCLFLMEVENRDKSGVNSYMWIHKLNEFIHVISYIPTLPTNSCGVPYTHLISTPNTA